MRLAGKVAIITGSGGGMGAVEAKLFAREGAQVVVADVLEDQGRQVVKEIGDAGGEAIFVRLDVTDEANWQAVGKATVEQFGKLNVMVNNAGIVGPLDPEESYNSEAWDRLLEINGKGVFLGIKHAIPEMRKDGGGSIVIFHPSLGLSGKPASTLPIMPPRAQCAF